MSDYTQADEGVHPPGEEALWQESVVLLWLDEERGAAGFQRIGQMPNRGTTNHWNGMLTVDDGTRFLADENDIPLVDGDRAEDALGSGDQRFTFFPGGGRADYRHGEDAELHVEFEDFYPMCQVWPQGTGGKIESDAVPNHYESSGRVRGEMRLRERVVPIDGFCHRDHSWGVRDWELILGHRWVVGTAGPHLAFSAAVILGDEDIMSVGYVYRNGERIQATGVDAVVRLEPDNVSTRGADVAWTLENGETLEIRCENVGGFIFSHGTWRLSDQLTRFTVVGDEQTSGMCLVETSTNHRLNNHPVRLSVSAAIEPGFSQSRERLGLFEQLAAR